MKGRMQKTMAQANDCPQRDRSETEWYEGVQTFMWIHEDNIAEVPFDKEHVLEQILNPENLSRAYKYVIQNGVWRYRQDVVRATTLMVSGQQGRADKFFA